MTALQDAAQKQLRSFIERIERLVEERKALGADIKDVFAEAKGVGFDVKIMRMIIAIRAKSKAEYQEEQAILDTYMLALGMADEAPLIDYIDRQRMLPASEEAEAAA